MKLTYTGRVRDGKLELPRKRIANEVQQFEGKAVTVTIQRKKKHRSTAQNAWYWGVCLEVLTTALRYEMPDYILSKELVHEMLKEKFLPVVVGPKKQMVIQSTGEVLEVGYTTTKLSTTEFMHYKDLVQQWAGELNIYIPDPHEEWPDKKTNIDNEL